MFFKLMFYKFLVALMLCAVIALFFINKPDGQKFLNPASIQQNTLQAIQQLKTQLTNIDIATLIDKDTLIDNNTFANINNDKQSVTLYRWQDKQGQWHFSNDINQAQSANKTTAETIIITANTSLATPKRQNTVTAPPATDNKPAQQPITSSTSALPFTNALDTLQDAKNIQTLMDNHGQQLDNSIKNIGK